MEKSNQAVVMRGTRQTTIPMREFWHHLAEFAEFFKKTS